MFCERYLIHFVGARAAREAGVSSESARAQACYFLHDPLIQARIRERTAQIMAEINEEQLKVFRELMNLATSDIRQLYNAKGKLKPLNEWPEQIAKCVSSIKQKVTGSGKNQKKSLEVKLWNKNQALENLARVVGLLTSELKVSLPDNVGSIYFPRPKEVGAPVDPAIIMRDQVFQLKLHPGGKADHGKEDETK